MSVEYRYQEVSAVFEEWESGTEMTRSMAVIVAESIDVLMDSELRRINMLMKSDPYGAFTQLMRLTTFLNAAIAQVPSIIGRLQRWTSQVHATVKTLANRLGADSFSIGVGFPWAVSIELSWNI